MVSECRHCFWCTDLGNRYRHYVAHAHDMSGVNSLLRSVLRMELKREGLYQSTSTSAYRQDLLSQMGYKYISIQKPATEMHSKNY